MSFGGLALLMLALLAACTAKLPLTEEQSDWAKRCFEERWLSDPDHTGAQTFRSAQGRLCADLARELFPGGQADASAARASECPGGLSCLPSPDGLGRPATCVDPAGYRFVSELCSATCEPFELRGQRWEQECVEGVEVGGDDGPEIVTGCSPVCETEMP